MAEGGMSPEAYTRLKTIGKVVGTLMTLYALTGCGTLDQRTIETAEAADEKARYSEMDFDGNAAEAYRLAYEKYLEDFSGKSNAEALAVGETFFQENFDTSGWVDCHTAWVNGNGVEFFDSAPALWHAVDDGDPSTSFSQELNNHFGKGQMLMSATFPDMEGAIKPLAEAKVPAKITRWDNDGGKTTSIVGQEAYQNAGFID